MDAGARTPAAHPNARFTVPADQNPACAPEWEDPSGVPISAVLFGGRRSTVVPLVTESFDWEHGVFLGSIVASETTAAAAAAVGKLRRDPFAMLPFCGYNMADYFAHWLRDRQVDDAANLPRIYYVNWFRKDAQGRFLWPGYGENSRVLAWIFDRVAGRRRGTATPIGLVPALAAIDTEGLGVSQGAMEELLSGRRGLADRGPAHPRTLRALRRSPSPQARRTGGRAREDTRLSRRAGSPATWQP